MKSELPKQFMKISGREIILHSIKKFLDFDPQVKIIVAVHNDYMQLMKKLAQENNLSIEITAGGETRFHSVKNSLALIHDGDAIVGIHDAARPLVSLETIRRCYDGARKSGNATPAIEVSETLREVKGNESRHVNRADYRVIQTPQCFKVSFIQKAFNRSYSESFTDDASVLEADGGKINLVEGNFENIKVTHPRDLIIAKALLEHEQR
jgi:2-C-methyl-D-erythritol 4-phosphate cytidylyltransferase